MKVVGIIQARFGSSRLPGKILLPLPSGRIVLQEVVHRVKQIKGLDEVIVAIPDTRVDDVLIPHLRGEGVTIFRGSEEDVLHRYYQAAALAKAAVIMRITTDCPLLEPQVCDLVLARFLEQNGELDFCSNTRPRTFPRGLDCEVFTWRLLEFTNKEARRKDDREHVTQWMLDSWVTPKLRIGSVTNDQDHSNYDWSLDTGEDYHRIVGIMTPKEKLVA